MSSRNDDMPPSQPPTKDEEREAEERREALNEGRDPLGAQLLAAVRPMDLPDEVHEQILARALALGVASPPLHAEKTVMPAPAVIAAHDEQAAATRLRDALAGIPPANELASLAHALKNAHAPSSISEIRNEGLLRPALRQPSRRANRFATVAGALAVAAGIFGLWLVDRQDPPGAAANLPPGTTQTELLPGMAPSRTTTDLFQTEDFPQTGGQSSRIDAITQSRRSDLRKNRFVSWGVP